MRELEHHSRHHELLLFIVVAVAMRVGGVLYMGDNTPPGKDETSYSLLAVRLLSGHGYSFTQAWYPFTPADTPTAHWSFLYTALVAAIYGLAGAHPLAVRLVQAVVLGMLMPWLTWRLARRAGFEDPVALVAALLAAVYPYFVLYGAMVQTEGFFLVAVLWSLERALALRETLSTTESAEGTEDNTEEERSGVRARQDRWLLAAITLGLSLGVAALLRQSILPWVVVLFGWLAWGTLWPVGRATVRPLAALVVAGLVMMAFILPVTVRNYRVYGDFLLLNSNAGYAMYSAQHPLHGTSFQAYAAAPLPTDVTPVPQNEAQWDRVLMARGMQFVAEDPGRYVLLSLSRAVDYLEFWPKAESSLLFNVGRVLSFGWLLPLSVAGIAMALRGEGRGARGGGRRSLTGPTALLLLFVATYSVLHILTWAMPRYRLPVDAVLVIFAAGAVVWGVRWMARRNGKVEPAL